MGLPSEWDDSSTQPYARAQRKTNCFADRLRVSSCSFVEEIVLLERYFALLTGIFSALTARTVVPEPTENPDAEASPNDKSAAWNADPA